MWKIITKTLLILPFCLSAHSGGTDSKGGHRNHRTGEYHFHHGMGPHQHTKDGVCIPKRNRNVIILVALAGVGIWYYRSVNE